MVLLLAGLARPVLVRTPRARARRHLRVRVRGGRLSLRLGQPRVIGEITAGLLLGPTLLGWLLPGVSGFLFPSELGPHLDALAKLGVILFVFFVGVEFQSTLLRGRAGSSARS